MPAREQRKGVEGEQDLARVLNGHGLPIDRTVQNSGRYTRGDLTGLPGYHFQCKRQETLRLPLWLREAQREAGESVPIVCWRQNRGPWYATLSYDDMQRLARGPRLPFVLWRDRPGVLRIGAWLKEARASSEGRPWVVAWSLADGFTYATLLLDTLAPWVAAAEGLAPAEATA